MTSRGTRSIDRPSVLANRSYVVATMIDFVRRRNRSSGVYIHLRSIVRRCKPSVRQPSACCATTLLWRNKNFQPFGCKVLRVVVISVALQTNHRSDNLLPLRVRVSLHNDVHVIETVKDFILPQFYCMRKLIVWRMNRMQMDMPTTNNQPNRLLRFNTAHCWFAFIHCSLRNS
jgi:hypothetical protein